MNAYRIRVREVVVYCDHADLHIIADTPEEAAAVAIEAVEQRADDEGQIRIKARAPGERTYYDFNPLGADPISTRVYCTEIVAADADPEADGRVVGPTPEPLVLPGVPDDRDVVTKLISDGIDIVNTEALQFALAVGLLRAAEQMPSSNDPEIEADRTGAITRANGTLNRLLVQYNRNNPPQARMTP